MVSTRSGRESSPRARTRPAGAVSVPAGRSTTVLTELYVHWPCVMAGFVVLIGALYDPAVGKEQLWPIPLRAWPEPLDFLLSWPLIASAVASGLLLRLAWQASMLHRLSATERMAMTWHLMNACFYHTLCDAGSGLLGVTPNLREAYTVQNDIHLLVRHHPRRVGWDTIYWFELLVETPFALLVLALYLRRNRVRYVVEAFLHGMHFAGAVAYYMPDMILGHTPHVLISNLDRLIACAWVVTPFLLLGRTVRIILAESEKQD